MAQRDNSGAAIKLDRRPLAGRQWRSAKQGHTQGEQAPQQAPAATRSSALPRRPSADADRELARKIADKYVSRTGKILIGGGKHG
jgi:hypothetical protein